MERSEAARILAESLPEGGIALLRDASLSADWSLALAGVDVGCLDVAHVPQARQADALLSNLREAFGHGGNIRAAIAFTRELIRRRVAEHGQDHPDALVELGALGALADRAGRAHDARQMLERAYEGLRSVVGGRDLRLAIVCTHLAWHCLRTEQPGRAEQYLDQALRIRRDVAPATTGPVAAQLAELYIRRQAQTEAVPLLWEAWERYSEQYGTTDKRTVTRARTLAAILVAQGREVEAIPVLRVVHEAATAEGDYEKRAAVAFQLAGALDTVGQHDEALRMIDDALKWTREHGDPHPELAQRLSVYSRMVLARGRPVEAEGLLMEALEAEVRVHGDGTAPVAQRYAQIGLLCAQAGRRQEAMGWLEPAASILRSTLGDEHWQTRTAVEALGDLWVAEAGDALRRREQRLAVDLLGRALDVVLPVLGEDHRIVGDIDAFGLI